VHGIQQWDPGRSLYLCGVRITSRLITDDERLRVPGTETIMILLIFIQRVGVSLINVIGDEYKKCSEDENYAFL